jgi:uncharacterized membrane protein
MVNQSLSANGPGNGPTMDRKSGRRLLAIFLFISLVANVFLAGLLAGRILHWDWLGGQQSPYAQQIGPFASHALERLLEPLDDADRQIVLNTVESHADELMQLNRSIREQRRVIAQLLKADNYDRKAVDDAFTELRKRIDTMQVTLQTALSDAVGKLPPDARKQLRD